MEKIKKAFVEYPQSFEMLRAGKRASAVVAVLEIGIMKIIWRRDLP